MLGIQHAQGRHPTEEALDHGAAASWLTREKLFWGRRPRQSWQEKVARRRALSNVWQRFAPARRDEPRGGKTKVKTYL